MPRRRTQSIDAFSRDPRRSLDQAAAAQSPLVLTERGRVRAVVLSPSQFANLCAAREYVETVAAVRRALDDPRPGIGLDQFAKRMRAKYSTPRARRRGAKAA